MLRDLVLRQLRSQARQQQAKEMVIAELRKTENASKELLAQVEELGAGRVVLTPEEENLFSEPELKEALTTSGVQATLVAGGGPAPKTKTEPAPKPDSAPAASSADALLEKGAAHLQANRLDDAAATYAEVLRADPRNVAGLIGLGNARLRAAKYADAEAALKKCLSLDAASEAAHFTLGISYFKQNRHREAITSFESSLAVNKQNARAHHYLGISSTKLGLLDRAEREFKTALAIDPAYGDAHFNLAVLYVTLDPPRWEDARAQYQDALKKGVKPDADLEKLLAPKTASAR
jgi:tetratricopeptide (TPR) repeat protein